MKFSKLNPETKINEKIQADIDLLVEELTVLDKTKLEWDRIKAKIDANALAGKDFDGVLGALLASTEAIDDKWQSILDKLAEYNSTPQGVIDSKNQVASGGDMSEEEFEEFIAVVEELDAAQAAFDAAEANSAENRGSGADAAYDRKVAAEAAARLAAAQAAYDATLPKVDSNDLGGGSGGAGAGRYGMQMLASGGMVKPNYFAMGGFAKGTDTVPAMLTPGEFVMSKYAVDTHGINTLKSMNNGQSNGGAVYNNTYTLTVNAKTDANPNEIAQAVMTTIKNVEGRRVRGVSLNG